MNKRNMKKKIRKMNDVEFMEYFVYRNNNFINLFIKEFDKRYKYK